MGKTAFLIIDAQTGIIEGPAIGPVHKKDELLHVLKTLYQQAKEQGIPVIYAQDMDVGSRNPATNAIHPTLAPAQEDTVIKKQGTDAFYGTQLDELLQKQGIEHLVIGGVKTEFCVDTTARSAAGRGYDVTLVLDGHSTTANRVLSAEQIIAHHNCNLHGLDNLNHFILVRDSSDFVFAHKHLDYK